MHTDSVTSVVSTSTVYSVDCSPPGSSVHGILQARILEWVAISFSRGSSWPRDRTCISYITCIGRRIQVKYSLWLDRYKQKPNDKNLLVLFRGGVRKQSRKTHRGQVTRFPNFQHFASQNPRTMICYWVGLGEKGLPTCMHVQGMENKGEQKRWSEGPGWPLSSWEEWGQTEKRGIVKRAMCFGVIGSWFQTSYSELSNCANLARLLARVSLLLLVWQMRTITLSFLIGLSRGLGRTGW